MTSMKQIIRSIWRKRSKSRILVLWRGRWASVSVSLLAVIVTKPKYVLVLYPVTDLPFKRSVKPHVLTLLDEVDKIGQSNLHRVLSLLDLEQNWSSNLSISSFIQYATNFLDIISSLLLDLCEIAHLAGDSSD